MHRIRVIPVVLIDNERVVKTRQFRAAQYIGDPINTVKLFSDKEADEIAILDIGASRNSSKPDLERIYDCVGEATMPVSYGGGITALGQISEILARGVEKVVMNSSAIRDPGLIEAAARRFGSSSIVVSVDYQRGWLGQAMVFDHVARSRTKYHLLDFVRRAENLGAGEILLNCVDRDGMFTGYDIDTIRCVTDAVSIPVVACGGASRLADFHEAVVRGGASAVAAGSLFVLQGPHRAVLISYPTQDVLEREIYSRIGE